MASRRFSQAISEGDGISVVADVNGDADARAAEEQGAEALVVRGDIATVRSSTELPILIRSVGDLDGAARAGADACLLSVAEHADDPDRLAALHHQALELGLDCVVEVRHEDELELALERLDPEIFLLIGDGDNDDPLQAALELLPDVPAGKLAVADVELAERTHLDELERAGVDAVIVRAGNVAELVGDAPPPV